MASHSVRLQPSVEKDFRRISGDNLKRIFLRINALADDPLPRGAAKLSGAEGLYRIRVGDYRIVYELDRLSKRVVIHYVRHRRDVYRHL
ncbi:MAG: type II toxin-antitoxin system RelE/ParE family toxin [Pirellulales bacterium]|nr:type II toxin-antitoxin system RelE/ParE family toxin [Pirellulales bacterium]